MEIELNKSARERIFHAVLFELLANVLIALFLAWFMQMSLLNTGALSLISALTATFWNYIFNKLFDGLQKYQGFKRTAVIRALHAVVFEVGLIAALTPIAMLLLGLSFVDALYVEMGLVLFFLPYTMAYNWLYDYIRWLFIGRRKQPAPQQ